MTAPTPLVTAETKPAEVLDLMLIALNEKGWAEGTFYDRHTGAVCTLGALDLVVFGSAIGMHRESAEPTEPYQFILSEKVSDALRRTSKYHHVASYNDKLAATQDVQALTKWFNRAKKKLR